MTCMTGMYKTTSTVRNIFDKTSPPINDRYEIIKYLGQGTYGKVNYCLDRYLDIYVAVKTIKPTKVHVNVDKSKNEKSGQTNKTSKPVSLFGTMQESQNESKRNKQEAAVLNEQVLGI